MINPSPPPEAYHSAMSVITSLKQKRGEIKLELLVIIGLLIMKLRHLTSYLQETLFHQHQHQMNGNTIRLVMMKQNHVLKHYGIVIQRLIDIILSYGILVKVIEPSN